MLLEKIIHWLKNFVRLFSNQNQAYKYRMDEENLRPADPTLVSYSEELIPKLKEDHQDLLNRYVEIGTLVEQSHYQTAVEKLNDFRSEFNRHLAQENVKFYAYCEQNFPESSEEYNTIKNYRKEMNLIAYTVVKFLKNWTNHQPLNAESASEFLQQYQDIAGALAKRIEDEERDLYSLYRDVQLDQSVNLQPTA